MSYLNWHVGMKVVCVDSKWDVEPDTFSNSVRDPIKGDILTIREMCVGNGPDWEGENLYLRFAEIHNPPDSDGEEAYYYAGQFRPLAELKTDISLFTAMLTDTKQKVPAE